MLTLRSKYTTEGLKFTSTLSEGTVIDGDGEERGGEGKEEGDGAAVGISDNEGNTVRDDDEEEEEACTTDVVVGSISIAENNYNY